MRYYLADLAATYGFRPIPFVPGLVFAGLGLILSLFLARETRDYARLEAQLAIHNLSSPNSNNSSANLSFKQVFIRTSWQDKSLFATSQAGMINNLNDGMVWGLVPLFLVGFQVPCRTPIIYTTSRPPKQITEKTIRSRSSKNKSVFHHICMDFEKIEKRATSFQNQARS